MNIVDITKKFHTVKDAIRNVLNINNVHIRKPGEFPARNKKQLSEEETKYICDLYKEGKSITFIAKNTHHKDYLIKRILEEHGLEIETRHTGPKIIFSEEQKNKIIEMNLKHYGYAAIAREMNCCADTIKDFMKENGIEKLNTRLINHDLNEDYFSVIDTEEKAYLLGLLKTDGYIKREKIVGISLKAEDKYMVDNFRKAVNSDSALIADDRPGKECYYVEILSEKLIQDLSNFDIVPNKTYKLTDIKINQIPKELQRHYLRGLLDGDGSIYIEEATDTVAVSFCGYSEDFVRSFQYAIDSMLNKEEHNKLQKTNAFQCRWKGNKITKTILEYLYKDSTIYLERKKKFYDLLKNK